MTKRTLAMLCLSFPLAACGSKSGIADLAGGPAGAGGNVGTGGTAGAGAGAGSGGQYDCVSMSSTTQVLELLRPSGWLDQNPAIVPSSDDGERVSVAAVSGPPNDDPWPQTLEQHHAAFEPWSAWPASPVLQPTYHPSGSGFIMPSFVLGELPGDGFAWLGSTWQIKGSTGAHLYLVDALSDVADFGMGGGWNVPIAAAALESGSLGRHFTVSHRQWDGAYLGSVSTPDVDLGFVHHWVGCSANPVGDARVFKSGYIVAFATVGSPGADGTCAPSSAEATRVEIVQVSGAGATDHLAKIEAGAPVTDISLAPHGEGAFLVYRTSGAASALHFARVRAASKQVIGPHAVTLAADQAMSGIDTAAAVGHRLALAWGSPKGVSVTLLGEDGSLITETSLPVPVTTRVGIASRKTEPSFVVTWGEAPGVTRVTRFDCQSGVP